LQPIIAPGFFVKEILLSNHWCAHLFAAMLTEMSGELEEVTGETRLEERLVTPIAMALARLWREAEEEPAGADRHKMILDVARQLSQLRRESLQAERVRMEQERWDRKKLEIALNERVKPIGPERRVDTQESAAIFSDSESRTGRGRGCRSPENVATSIVMLIMK
jgi:hypothetical protein